MRTDRHGQTLVEVVLAIGLFAFVGLASLHLFLAAVTVHARVESRLEAQEAARLAMNRTVYELRRASGWEDGSGIGVDLAETSGSVFVTTVPGGGTVSFDVLSGVLRADDGSGPVALTPSRVRVTGFMIRDRSDASSPERDVELTLTVTKPDPTGAVDVGVVYTLRTAVRLRGR